MASISLGAENETIDETYVFLGLSTSTLKIVSMKPQLQVSGTSKSNIPREKM